MCFTMEYEQITPCEGQLSFFDVMDIKTKVLKRAHEIAADKGIRFDIKHRAYVEYQDKQYKIRLVKGELDFQGQIMRSDYVE